MRGTTIWHEAWPGVLGSDLHVCHHEVVGTSKLFVNFDERCANPDPRSIKVKRVRRDELDTGVGVDVLVSDGRYRHVVWMFAGPVPAKIIRPPGFLREQRRASRRAQEESRDRARHVSTSPAGGLADDLILLGLPRTPTEKELKFAWRHVAQRTHPDKGGTAEKFSAARAAYERLLRVVA